MVKLFSIRLYRTIIDTFRQFVALIIVVMVATALYCGLGTAYTNLKNNIEGYYKKTGFPDFIVTVPSAPESISKELQKIDGVSVVTARIQHDIEIKKPNGDDITARLTSFNTNEEKSVTTLYKVSGEFFTLSNDNNIKEIMFSNRFFNLNHFSQGNIIEIKVGNSISKAKIIGTVGSAELNNMTRTFSSLLEGETFGPVVMDTKEAQKLLSMDNDVNQFTFKFKKGANKDKVIKEINKFIKPYSPIAYEKKKDHPAIKNNNSILSQIKTVSFFFPTIFMICSMFFLYIILRQTIRSKRKEIGMLKAIGFSNSYICSFYITYSVLVSITGAILGGMLGKVFTYFILKQCQQILQLPFMNYNTNFLIIIKGLLICIIVGLTSGLMSALEIAKIMPSEAIRGRNDDNNELKRQLKFIGILSKIPDEWKIAIRSILRNKTRFIVITLGLITTSTLLFASFACNDSKKYLIDHFFDKESVYDYFVSFNNFVDKKDLDSWTSKKGIEKMEFSMQIPIKIYKGDSSNKLESCNEILWGLEKEPTLKNVYNSKGKQLYIGKGIILSEKVAEKLNLKKGDTVTIEAIDVNGTKVRKETVIDGISSHYLMRYSFTNIGFTNELIDTKSCVNVAVIKATKSEKSKLINDIQKDDKVSYIQGTTSQREQAGFLFKGIDISVYIVIFCALLMGFALVFSFSMMNFLQRKKEFAVLRVIGFKQSEISLIIFNELLLQMIIAIPISIPLGKIMCDKFLDMISNDTTLYPKYIYACTYGYSIAVIILFCLFGHMLAMKRIKNMEFLDDISEKD